jgi:hypothetical protein
MFKSSPANTSFDHFQLVSNRSLYLLRAALFEVVCRDYPTVELARHQDPDPVSRSSAVIVDDQKSPTCQLCFCTMGDRVSRTLPTRDTLPNMGFDSTSSPTHVYQVSSGAVELKLGCDYLSAEGLLCKYSSPPTYA